MRTLDLHSDIRSIPTWLRQITENGYEIGMAADTEYSLAVPTDAKIAIFNSLTLFSVSDTSGISFASTGTWLNQASELSPTGLILEGISTLYFKSQEENYLKVSFYR